MSWFWEGVRSPDFKTKIGNTELETVHLLQERARGHTLVRDTEVGRDVQRGLVMEKTFDLDLGIWLQFRFAQTGVGRKK